MSRLRLCSALPGTLSTHEAMASPQAGGASQGISENHTGGVNQRAVAIATQV